EPPAGAGGRPAASLASGVARSGAWAASGDVAKLSATLVAAPFTIRLLGPAGYGLWSLLQSVVNYFNLADLGMATASTRFAAQRYARHDAGGEAAGIWTALFITTALTAAAALAAALAAPLIVSQLLHVRGSLRSEGILALRLLAAAAVAYAASNTLNTPQQVRLRWKSLTLATSGPRVTQIAIAPVVLLATAGGVVAMAAVVLAAAMAAASLNFLVARRLLPDLSRPRAARDAVRPMTRYGVALAISGMAAVPLMTAERFLLAHFRSPTEVAYYAVASALGSLLAVMPGAMAQPLLPALTRLAEEGKAQEHRQLYHQILRGVFLIVTPVSLVLAFLAGPLLGLWAGTVYEAHSVAPFYVIVAALWFNALAYLPLSQLLASGRTSTIAAIHVAELIPYLVLAALLTASLGALGAAIAWSARVIVDAVAFFALVQRGEGLSWIPTPTRRLAFVLITAAFAALLWTLSRTTSSLPLRLGWSLAALALYGAVTVKRVLTAGERQGVLALLRDILPARLATGLGGTSRG
ncbi:MAG: oligosaccharide flippase family protein, partial [Solirubrobacteraceae bacterium]